MIQPIYFVCACKFRARDLLKSLACSAALSHYERGTALNLPLCGHVHVCVCVFVPV